MLNDQCPIINLHGHDGDFYEQKNFPLTAALTHITLNSHFGQYPHLPQFKKGHFIIHASSSSSLQQMPKNLTLLTHSTLELMPNPLADPIDDRILLSHSTNPLLLTTFPPYRENYIDPQTTYDNK